jgi:superfamily II DNA or RNA helicase
LILRSYQQELVQGALALWGEGHRRIAAVMATGGGKTPTAMTIAELSIAAGHPVLWIAHRTELIDQAIDKAKQVAPSRRIGRVQGRDKQYRAEIVVASIQTASTDSTMRLLKERTWGLIIVDETHHITASTYMKLLRELGAFDAEGPLVLGVTATLDRSDGQALGQVFEQVVKPQIGLIDLIRHPEGPFLVPPRGIRVKIAGLDLDKVKRVAGDFNSAALGRAMSDAMAPKRIVEAYIEHAQGRPTVAFLPTVAISIEQAQTFNDAGIAAVHLDGTTPAPARAEALEAFRRGEITVLCNVGLFTEGTDLPSIACVILGRPTSSTSLYQQMVGRGLRLHPGKVDCVILDVSGVTSRHRLATLVSLHGADRPEDVPDELLMYEPDEDEVLAEAQTEQTEPDAGEPEPIPYVDGDLAHELVDLFSASHSTWLRTTGGTWFIPVGAAGYLFLRYVGDDRYDLVGLTPHGAQHVLRDTMEIGYAMAAGDELITANPMWQADRDASWRKLRAYRSVRTRGEIADERAVAFVSAQLDR